MSDLTDMDLRKFAASSLPRLITSTLWIGAALYLMAFPSLANATSNSGITYHGRILKPDGTPLEGKTVQFRLQIRSPGAESCLLYEELQTLNMVGSAGVFSISLNDGTGTRDDSSGVTFDNVFSNRTSVSFAGSACVSGNQYNPNSADGRSFAVFFRDESMQAFEPLPSQPVNYAPFAIQTKEIAGFGPTNLLRFDDTATANNATPLNISQLTNLLALINGTSTQYASTTANGIGLPVLTTNPLAPTAGSVWYNSTTNTVQYYNGTSSQALGAAGPASLSSGQTGILPIANGGTGSSSGSITGSGALILAAGGTNQNVSLTPSGSGATVLGGNVGIGTASPGTTLDVNGGIRAGSSTVVTVTCNAGNEGIERYNYSTHFKEYCNGSNWTQFTVQAAASTIGVSTSGPPVSAGIYTIATATANYTPGFGAVANTYNGNWPAVGASAIQNAACVELDPQSAGAQQIVYDLGSVKSIGNIYVAAEGPPYGYMNAMVSFSLDNVTFNSSVDPYLSNQQTIQYSSYTLSTPISARYIKLVNGGSNTGASSYDTFCQIAVGP